MKMQMQRIYGIRNKTLISISPYARILRIDEKRIKLYREDVGTGIILTATDLSTVQYLINLLNQGIEQNRLVDLLIKLGVNAPDSWIGLCKSKGVIE